MSTLPKGTSPLRVFLIRHGETVDNVAGLYAGSRDSALTFHGVQQAQRLGHHFVELMVQFQHIFSSDLSRAASTAGYIRKAQENTFKNSALKVIEVVELREQDFGWLEGKSFHARTTDAITAGGDARSQVDDDDATDLKDPETKESLGKRANKFVEEHLLPAIHNGVNGRQQNIAIVSHGIFLAALWRCLLRRQAPQTVEIDAELLASRAPTSLEHIGGWSNTGYLELEVQELPNNTTTKPADANGTVVVTEQASGVDDSMISSDIIQDANLAKLRFSLKIKSINSKIHLQGLKRAINGSSKYDEGQTSIATFFKKQRT